MADHPRDEASWRQYREMSEELREICVDAIRSCEELPPEVVENCNAAGQIEISAFDESYIEFLEGMIARKVRGPEWNKRLKRRVEVLTKYVDRELADCRLHCGDTVYWIKINPLTGMVVYWED